MIHRIPPVLALFTLLLVVFGLLAPRFFSLDNLLNILVQASSLGIIATGMTFVLLTAGIDLSVGSVMFLAGVVSAKLVLGGWPLAGAFAAVLGVGLVFGYVNAWFVNRLRIVPFIVTLATFYVGRGLGLFVSQTRAINLPEGFTAVGSATLLGVPLPVVVLAVVVGVAHLVLTRTPYGRWVYAVGEAPEKARKAGLPVGRVLVSVYVISGALAALGGFVALAQLGAVSPTFGYQREFEAIAAAVLGGTSLFGGRGAVLPGTLLGALFVQSLATGLNMVNANPYLYPVVSGAVIFLIVMIDSLRHRREELRRRLGLLTTDYAD